uniref:MBOAT_2 domain-containing protein n=1 Tax=Globodera pallida TaxID=36090 RepID=A0A183BYV6_GLOPA
MVFGLSCPLCQVPHLILAASLILSAFKAFRFHAHAKVLFHAMSGLMLLVYPQLIYGPMISGGKFDAVHVVLQRFTAPYHLGFAFFHCCSAVYDKVYGVNAVILFSKAITAAFILMNKLISAFLLYEQRARGHYISQNFLACSLILDGIWLLVELYALIYSSRSSLSDEIELMCARTRRWIDTGHSNFGSQRAVFWIDSAICLFSAMFQFAFAEQLLKLMIIREHIITELHEMYAREFACQCLAPAIISLVASFQFSTGQQKHYIGQRILSQAMVCILSGWAHFGVGLFAPAHTVPFVLSFFHCALLAEALEDVIGAGGIVPARLANIVGGGNSSPAATYVFRTTTVQKVK